MALGAVLLQIALDDPISDLLAPHPDRAPSEWAVALGMAVGLAVVLLSRVMGRRSARARGAEEAFQEALQMVRPEDVFALAVMSALAEEIFFRGFLQPHLGLEVTALIFGLVHIPWDRRLLPWWSLAALVMGWVLGWMMEVTGTLLAPTLAHFTINFFNLHHLLRPQPGGSASPRPSRID